MTTTCPATRDPAWVAFLDWRCRQVADLVIDFKAALPAGTALAVIPTVPHGSAARLEGTDIGMLAVAADALEIPCIRRAPRRPTKTPGTCAGAPATIRHCVSF